MTKKMIEKMSFHHNINVFPFNVGEGRTIFPLFIHNIMFFFQVFYLQKEK